MDDVLIFFTGTARDINTLCGILELFSKAIRMEENERKSTLTSYLLSDDETLELSRVFTYNLAGIDEGLKYLGLCLKPNDYHKWD